MFNNTFFRKGLPFLIMVIGGSYVLKEFTSLRYEFSRKESPENKKYKDDLKALLKEPEDRISIETEYEKIKQLDIENWKNKRIPRPWEEGVTETK